VSRIGTALRADFPRPASGAERLALGSTAKRCYEGEGPDPRFGMSATVTPRQTLLAPAGLLRTETAARTAALADPLELLSLQTLTDTRTVNGRSATRVFQASAGTNTHTSAAGGGTSKREDIHRRRSFLRPASAYNSIAVGVPGATNGRLPP